MTDDRYPAEFRDQHFDRRHADTGPIGRVFQSIGRQAVPRRILLTAHLHSRGARPMIHLLILTPWQFRLPCEAMVLLWLLVAVEAFGAMREVRAL